MKRESKMEEVKGKMEDCHTDSELLTQFHKNKPQLRFSGFDDDWEEKKLGEVSDRVTRKNENLESTLPLTISAQYGLVDQITFFNNQIASTTNLRNYFLVKNGEFAYNKSYSAGYPWGAIKRLDRYEKGVLSTLYIVFKPKNINSDYLLSYYDTDKWYKQVSEIAAEGARNHGLLNIAPNDFFQTTFYAPKSENEQQKIGTILSKFDSLIQAKTKKLESLKAAKKSLLQKCFPKEGEKVPEMRFAGFSGEWEEKTIGEIAEIITGGTPSTSHEDYWFPKEIPWLSSGEVNKKYILFTDDYISKKGFSNSSAHWIKSNSVLIALAGQGKTRGTVAINMIPLTTNQSIAGIILNNEMDTNFVFQSLERKYEAIRKMSSGDGSRGGLNKQLVSEITFMCPLTLNEQQKIGQFFAKYDSLISLQKKEIENLKTIKKSLLQKMFV